MSKVTVELDFMWEKRLLDYYNGIREDHDIKAIVIVTIILKHLGLTVEGIE